jgi:hypothetical protein
MSGNDKTSKKLVSTSGLPLLYWKKAYNVTSVIIKNKMYKDRLQQIRYTPSTGGVTFGLKRHQTPHIAVPPLCGQRK